MTLSPEHTSAAVTGLEWAGQPPLWIGDGATVDAPDHHWGAAAVELLAAPGRRDEESREAAILSARMLASRIVRSLHPWQNAGGLELRYVWGAPTGRLRVLLVARALGRSADSARRWAAHMLEMVTAQFPAGYDFGPLDGALPDDITAWVEVCRAEETRATGPFVPSGLADYYYLVHPLAGDGSAWPDLPGLLARSATPGFLSIALLPTVLTETERSSVDRVVTLAQHLSETQQGYDFFGNATTTPADAAARDVLAAWQGFTDRDGVLVRVGVAARGDEVVRIASQVGATLTQMASGPAPGALPTTYALVTDLNEFDAWQTATLGVVLPRGRHAVWGLPPEQAPVPLERMPYFFTDEDAAGLLVLPVPDTDGVPGIPRARRGSDLRAPVQRRPQADGVRLGPALDQGQQGHDVVLPLAAVNRHVLVVGSPGSGKTSTVLHLLVQLWRDHQIPFLVIESVLSEYRSLLSHSDLDGLRVITLGNESIAPLRLNPLAPPPGVRCEVHRGAVMAALKLALPLVPPLPQILGKALTRTYRAAGWDDETVLEDGLVPPTLRDLLHTFRTVFRQIGYRGEAENIGLAFQVRLESLLEGSRGRVLDTVSSVDFDELLTGPVVVELNEVADSDERAVLAAFLLDRVRAGAKRRGSSGGRLQHVTVLEEAHRLLGRASQTSGDAATGDQARADSVRAFCEAIAELRSLGEGFVLSSQSPTALAEVAIANTGTRILHRMESSADRTLMLDDLDAPEPLRAAAAGLAVGEAVVRWPHLDEAELVRVRPDEAIDSGRQIDDRVVRDRMSGYRAEVTRLLPHRLCSPQLCPGGCTAAVRRDAEDLADDLSDTAVATWRDAITRDDTAVEPLTRRVLDEAAGDIRLGYCTAVQLSARGDAFTLDGSGDHRPVLLQAFHEAATRRA